MPDSNWHHIENQFDNSTKQSFKRMRQQSIFHRDALANAPVGIRPALLARINAAHGPFIEKYDEWVGKAGLLKGATQSYEERLALLTSDDIETIETAFKAAFKRGTAEHTSAFPQGREPFQSGGADARIGALGVLKTRCDQLIGPLQTALADAEALPEPQQVIDKLRLRVLSMQGALDKTYETTINLQGLRTLQNDLENERDQARIALQPLRVALADAHYANMCGLGQELFTAALRPQVATFFNLDILRQTGADEEDPAPIPPPVP